MTTDADREAARALWTTPVDSAEEFIAKVAVLLATARAQGREVGRVEGMTEYIGMGEGAYTRGWQAAVEAAAQVAEHDGYSVIDLGEKMGPFTLQDKATESCCQIIAAAIRALEPPDGK